MASDAALAPGLSLDILSSLKTPGEMVMTL
jgi:hypothetical protein